MTRVISLTLTACIAALVAGYVASCMNATTNVPAAPAAVLAPPPPGMQPFPVVVYDQAVAGQHCGNGGACNFDCPSGSCAFTCDGGSTCNVSCPGGDCRLACEAGATCNFDCDGGSCVAQCDGGSTCNVTCDGGSCSASCAPGATCAGRCTGGDCT